MCLCADFTSFSNELESRRMRLGEAPKKAISEGVKQNPLSAKQRVLD
jgi:hypothetical protein